ADDTLLGRHAAPVRAVAVTPDGATVRSVGEDGLLREWDARARREVGTPLRVSAATPHAAAFDRAGRHLAVEAPDRASVAVWDADARQLLRTVSVPHVDAPHGHSPRLALSPDG